MLGGQYSSKYEEIELLGRNPQDDSEMFLVKDTLSQQYRMAKKISLSDNDYGDESQILNEASMLKQLSHPHILHYYDIHLEDQVLISLLQFCEEGDLHSYIQKKKSKKEGFSEKLLLSWLMQLLMGLEYIHNKHVVHRLIATRNIYLNHQGDLKIGAFGSAKILENTLKKAVTVVTMPCNMSPEMVQGQPYNTKADIWALGCLIFEMAALKPLYNFGNLAQLYDLIVEKASPDLPPKYGKYLNPIYRKMMKKNPNQRLSASDLLKEEVFVSLMRDYIKKKKIDSLDLKYIVPKRLTIHNSKETPKKQRVKLPPISPTLKQNNESGTTPYAKNKAGGTKTESNSEHRSVSRQKKSPASQSINQQIKMEDSSQSVPERITPINQGEGIKISHLCEAKLTQILQKYKPNMSFILEKTYDFQQLSGKK